MVFTMQIQLCHENTHFHLEPSEVCFCRILFPYGQTLHVRILAAGETLAQASGLPTLANSRRSSPSKLHGASPPDPSPGPEFWRIPDPGEFAAVGFGPNPALWAGVEPSLSELEDSRPWRIRGGRARPGRVCSCPTLVPADPSYSY